MDAKSWQTIGGYAGSAKRCAYDAPASAAGIWPRESLKNERSVETVIPRKNKDYQGTYCVFPS